MDFQAFSHGFCGASRDDSTNLRIFKDFDGFWWILMDFDGFSSIFMDFVEPLEAPLEMIGQISRFSTILMDFNGFRWIFKHFHGFCGVSRGSGFGSL